jgi:squalene synthase HpnC
MAESVIEQEPGPRAQKAHAAGFAAPETAAASDSVAAKAAHENFPVALRMMPRRYREHLMAVYVYARTVDDIGDRARPADRPRLLAEMDQAVRDLYDAPAGRGAAGRGPGLPAVSGLARTIRECSIPIQPFIDLIRANQQDQVVSRYQRYDDLAGYCELSANPVGRIVLHIFGCYDEARAARSDLICTGLQLAEHWQDVAEDLRAGRIYLPLDDLAEHGCTEDDLAAPSAGPAVRQLMAAEVARARGLIDAGAPLIGSLRGAARVAVAGYVAGGRAALAAIAAADYDVLSATRRPGRARTVAELLAAYAKGR